MAARLWSAVLIASLVPVGAAVAQVPTTAEPLTPRPFFIRRAPGDLDRLTALYEAGDWAGLERLARDIVCVAARGADEPVAPDDPGEYATCGTRPPESVAARALDLERHHVAVTWTAADRLGGTRVLRAVIAARPRRPFDPDLPGVGGTGDSELTEVFLSRSPYGRTTSLYTSARKDDPVLAQLPAFARALAGPLLGAVSGIAGSLPAAVAAPPASATPRLSATVSRVRLPFRRASVRLQAAVVEPVTPVRFAAAASALADSLALRVIPHEPCARSLARTLAEEIPAHADACAAAGPAGCLGVLDPVLLERFDEALGRCDGGKPPRSAVAALETVDGKFRELAQTGTFGDATLDVTFENRPLTHVSFGAGAGVVLGASLSRPRVETRNGVIVADPLDRVLSLAFVNWSPAGYDSEDPHISLAERVRPFVGAALTPDFGPAFGVNVLLVRGLGISAGGAVLFGKGADASAIGQKPSPPEDPYDLAVATAAFVGITYTYK